MKKISRDRMMRRKNFLTLKIQLTMTSEENAFSLNFRKSRRIFQQIGRISLKLREIQSNVQRGVEDTLYELMLFVFIHLSDDDLKNGKFQRFTYFLLGGAAFNTVDCVSKMLIKL